MDIDSDKLEFKKLVVKLKERQDILAAEVNHLRGEIDKRVSDIQVLLAQRELALNKEPLMESNFSSDQQKLHNIQPQEVVDSVRTSDLEHSSEFARQVENLVNNLRKTSEEVSTLIKI